MKVTPLQVPEVLLIEPRVFGDHRGYFLETWHQARYAEHGIDRPFVQDNASKSKKGILRGLHLQHPYGQGKLVRCAQGSVFDVAVDVRVGSPTFGAWAGAALDAESHRQMWVPPGFAHGFLVTSNEAVFAYKCTELYRPETELSVHYADPAIGVAWPDVGAPMLSEKDQNAPALADIDPARLPRYEPPR